MAAGQLDKKKDTQHHILALTDQWAAFVDAAVAEATAVVGERQRAQAQPLRSNSPTQNQPGGNPQ